METNEFFESISGGHKSIDGDYEVHTFTSSGTLAVRGQSLVDILVVGGGGGGGATHQGGGGGGGGGVVYKQGFVVTSGVYQVSVGSGGAGAQVTGAWEFSADAANGGDSSVFGLVALGGGAGGFLYSENGRSGCNGGGASALRGGDRVGGTGLQGFDGGNAPNTAIDTDGTVAAISRRCFGAGGGGAGGVGANASTNAPYGVGGVGFACAISGVEMYYGGGGGGGVCVSGAGAAGGMGGGGQGGYRTDTGTGLADGGNGEANTGGGGGGGGSRYNAGGQQWSGSSGGSGGSGVVIIRCRHFVRGAAIRFR